MDDRIAKTTERLNEVSRSFCLAKWSQVTLHLQNGHNHSCHHPSTHKADPHEVALDPSALHNTSFKKKIRQDMLDGERPRECEFCWAAERAGETSDRILKSSMDWATSQFNKVLRSGSTSNITPSYVEVSFSNVCNFKCSYCAPHISSKWMEEIRQHGGYPTSSKFNDLEQIKAQGQMPIPEREENPYVDAFWKWWPSLYPELMDFRITGGEPLMSKHTLDVMQYIIDNPNPKLRFSVNTNLCVPDQLYTRFLDLLKKIHETKACADFILYTSADTFGEQAEYIRNGMNYQQWLNNIGRYYDWIPKGKVVIMSTFNALSPFGYQHFVEDIYGYRAEGHRIILDIPHLVFPRHQSMWVLPTWVGSKIDSVREYIDTHPKVLATERIKIGRIAEMFRKSEWTPEQLQVYRKDFGAFFQEHDRRRGTDFRTTFPELVEFYNECLELK